MTQSMVPLYARPVRFILPMSAEFPTESAGKCMGKILLYVCLPMCVAWTVTDFFIGIWNGVFFLMKISYETKTR